MSFDKKPNVFDCKIPNFIDQNQPDTWPDILQARLFSIELFNVKFQDLEPNEQAFFNHIKNNIQYYDIIFKEKKDGTIDADIGSFDRHLVQNRVYLWIPFLVFSVISNYASFLTTSHVSLITTLLNGFIFLIAIFGIPTTFYKDRFEKKSFYKWYPALIISAALISTIATLIS